jgi:SAM-dependent methyltransferase
MESSATPSYACPRCDRALDAIESGFRCAGCKVEFPLISGLPWLFAEPNAALAEWRARFDYLIRVLEANAKRYLNAANRTDIVGSTKSRLEALAAATSDHGGRVRKLLAPLELGEPLASIETYLALRTRLPPDQGLMTYFPNVHRDWSWGREENEASIAVVVDALGDHEAHRVLVLGSGAGRLAYDLHERTQAGLTVALDFNPLLSLVGSRVAAGETIELYEFPLAPIDASHAAILRELAAPGPARAGLRFAIADVHRPPLPAKSFDTVVTPWLIDILPGDFAELCARINYLLDDDGVWINFGSLNFHQADPAAQLGPDECFEIVERHGFGAPVHRDTRIPYMCSPASRHARHETVLSWSAPKERHIKRPARHEALPDWIVRGRDPIPAIEHFRVAALSTRIHAQIMSLIDGRRSIADIAALLERERLMPATEAEASIRGLLIRLFDESQIRRP